MKIVHLSDLHFGDLYLFNALRNRRWYKYEHDPTIQQALENAVVELEPDVLVVSGDIVSKENANGFEQAAVFLKKIIRRLSSNAKKSLVVVPGNHDAPISKRLETDELERIRGFRAFLSKLYGISIYDAKERNFWLFPSHKVCIFGFDSTLKGRTERKNGSTDQVLRLAEGAIGPSQLNWYRETYADLREWIPEFDQYYKIAVLHHHPFPLTQNNFLMQLDDAAPFLECLSEENNSTNMILHGHKHVPTAAERRYTNHPLIVISAGTSLFNIVEEQAECGNSFNYITIQDTKVTCHRYRANEHKEFAPDNMNDGTPAMFEFPNYKTVGEAAWAAGLYTKFGRKILDLQSAKDKRLSTVEFWHEGFKILSPGKRLKEISPRNLTASNPLAKITDVHLIPEQTDLNRVKLQIIRGEETNSVEYKIIFAETLTTDSSPVNFALRYTIHDGTCMELEKFQSFYPGDTENLEDTSFEAVFPIGQFNMLVLFPSDYVVSARMSLTQYGEAKQSDTALNFNNATRTVECSLRDLSHGMRCKISWPVLGA